MSSDTSRSEQVIEGYKKHKLAHNALRRIRDLIHEFEAGRVLDLRLAQFGSVIILGLLGISAWFLLSADRLPLF